MKFYLREGERFTFLPKNANPNANAILYFQMKSDIRGYLGSKMGLIRKCANNKFCDLEFKNQYNFNKMSQP